MVSSRGVGRAEMSINDPFDAAEFRVDFCHAVIALLCSRSLDPHDLQAFLLRLEGYTYTEIGDILRSSKSSAERGTNRTRRTIAGSGHLDAYQP